MDEQHERTDVIVVGAGPAGSTAAALLAARGRDVILADRAVFPRDKTCGDGLTPRAIAMLDRLGLKTGLENAGYQRITGALTVAPNGTESHVCFADYDLGLPDFGLVVPRYELDDYLRRYALDRGARFWSGLHVAGPSYDGRQVDGVRGHINGRPVSISAPVTILATGASMGLLRRFGVLNEMPPGVLAVRGYFSGIPNLGQNYEFYFDRELSPGYGWVFPLADGRANVGIGLFARQRASGHINTRQALAEFMARHPRLAKARPEGPVKGYPIRTDFPSCAPSGPGFLVAGEALGLVHPVTGEGIDLAMESAELAAQVADAALQRGDAGLKGLAEYRKSLMAHYGNLFRGLQIIRRLATGPRALNILIGKSYKPDLGRTIFGINLGVLSPWTALSPHTWRDILG